MDEQPISILIVEDDAVDRQMLRRTLASTELTVSIDEVGTASDAVESLRDKNYDLALLDYKLPDGTGISVLKALQEHKNSQTPIIVLTVHAQKKVAMEALNEGAQDFLPKDMISADSLERAIRYAIQRTKLFKELQWSKERELRERELRAFQESVTEFDTAPPPAIKESAHLFQQFIDEYKKLIVKAVEETAFKGSPEVPDRLRELAKKLAELQAGPKDVVDVHTIALKQSVKNQTQEQEHVLTDEARIVLVQLMGYLCLNYRNRLLTVSAGKLQGKNPG